MDNTRQLKHFMNPSQQQPIIGNRFLCIYLLYILWVVNVEWINFFLSLAGMDIPAFGAAELVALLLVLVLFILGKKYFAKDSVDMTPELCMGIIVILVYGCLVSVYPDRAWDTYNYHIIAQSPKFRNYFDGSYFGLGHFQVWGFRLGDRLFYYFRCLLGFRMGTILNTLILAIAYTQVYQLLDLVTIHCEKNFLLRLFFNKGLWSMVILLYTQSILMFGTYYVDVLALPIGLEIVKILVENRKTTSWEIAYFALLNGIFLSFKLTNIVYVIACVLIFLYLKFRDFKVCNWVAAISLGLYPSAVYLIYNFLCTGNPVFPYFNAIFRSPYYPLMNWKDERWGGTNLFEKFFWILYAVFKPEYRQCEIHDSAPPIVLMLGIVGMVIMIGCALAYKAWRPSKAINIISVLLICVTLSSSMLWSFTTGYARYFVFARVLWGLIAYCFLVKLQGKFRLWGNAFACIFSVMALLCLGYDMKSSFKDGTNWSWTAWSKETFKEELEVVFKDRTLITDPAFDIDLFLLADQSYQGIAELWGDACIINTGYAGLAEPQYHEALNRQMAMADKIADIHKRTLYDIETYIDTLNNIGFEIISFEDVDTYLGHYEIVLLKPAESVANTCWISDDNPYEIVVENAGENYNLSFLAGRYYDWQGMNPITLKIYALSESGERELSAIEVDNISIDTFTVPLKLKETEQKIIIKAYESNNDLVSEEQINKVFMINVAID